MGWDDVLGNRHIYADLANWLVYVAMEQERPIAAIYCMRGKMSEILESILRKVDMMAKYCMRS